MGNATQTEENGVRRGVPGGLKNDFSVERVKEKKVV